jgi:urease accessory protein
MDDASLIAAFQLADSFFPSGMVTLSHGLETFLSIQPSADVNIAHLLDDYLRGKIAPCDLVAYAHAYRAAEASDLSRLQEIDQLLTAALLPQELRQSSARSGRALLVTLQTLVDAPLFQRFCQTVQTGESAGNAAACLGVLCVAWSIPLRAGALVHLYTFAVSFLSAALRLGRVGHREVQRLLLALRPQLSPLVDNALTCDLADMSAFAPLADIRAMQHAYLPVRLFSS